MQLKLEPKCSDSIELCLNTVKIQTTKNPSPQAKNPSLNFTRATRAATPDVSLMNKGS